MTTTKPSELLVTLRELNASAAHNRWAGFEVVAAEPGRVDLELRWRADLGQYAGFLHAGVTSALLDTACGFAAYSRVGGVVASNLSVCFLAAGAGDRFRASARVVRAGRRQVFTSAELTAHRADGSERLVATATTILVPTGDD